MSFNTVIKTSVGAVIGAGLAYAAQGKSPAALYISGALLIGQAVAWLPTLARNWCSRVQDQSAPSDFGSHQVNEVHNEEKRNLLAPEAVRIPPPQNSQYPGAPEIRRTQIPLIGAFAGEHNLVELCQSMHIPQISKYIGPLIFSSSPTLANYFPKSE